MMNLDELEKALIKGLKRFFSVDFVPNGVAYFWKTLKLLTMLIIIAVGGEIVYIMGDEVFHWWNIESRMYQDDLGYGYTHHYEYKHGSQYGFITDSDGRKVVKDVSGLHQEYGDSILIYEQNNFRGYLNLKSGRHLVKADKYTAAYFYREGRALAMTDDRIYILDEDGHEVGLSFANTGERNTDINCFHNGGLPMAGPDGQMGVIDRNAQWVIKPQFDYVTFGVGHYWIAKRYALPPSAEATSQSAYAAVYDDSFHCIIDGEWSHVWVSADAGIIATAMDNSQRRYDFSGNLVSDFVFETVETMAYETGNTEWHLTKEVSYGYDSDEKVYDQEVPVTGIANLLKYTTSDGWEGLMTTDGKPLTAPSYWEIKAIAKNLYVGSLEKSGQYSVLLNEKGQEIGRTN